MWVSEGCVCHCQPSDEDHPYLKQVKKQISTQEKEAETTVRMSAATSRLLTIYEGWNFNSGNYLFTTDTK